MRCWAEAAVPLRRTKADHKERAGEGKEFSESRPTHEKRIPHECVKGARKMKKKNELDQTHVFFSTETIEDIAILRLNEHLLFSAADSKVKWPLFDYLDLVSKSEKIKVLLIMGPSHKTGCKEYIQFYREAMADDFDRRIVERLYNAVNQFILNMVALDKLTIHADRGEVISLFLNVSLACNYRIVADDTAFVNPCLKLGLAPKGGGAFFLPKMLGASKALEILLSEEEIPAWKAQQRGFCAEHKFLEFEGNLAAQKNLTPNLN